jgi:hypothetical protein
MITCRNNFFLSHRTVVTVHQKILQSEDLQKPPAISDFSTLYAGARRYTIIPGLNITHTFLLKQRIRDDPGPVSRRKSIIAQG